MNTSLIVLCLALALVGSAVFFSVQSNKLALVRKLGVGSISPKAFAKFEPNDQLDEDDDLILLKAASVGDDSPTSGSSLRADAQKKKKRKKQLV